MDTFARGLEIAFKLYESKELENAVKERYSSYQNGIGKKITEGGIDLEKLERYAFNLSGITNSSGRQELLESIVNRYIL